MADAYSYLVALFLAATIAINFVINVVVLVMMRRRRLYAIVANRLFLQFVLIDFIACFFVFIPASVTSILGSWEFSDPACHVHGVMTTFVYLVIFGLLIMRCAERITKIKNRDLHKAVFCSNCRLMLVSLIVWALGMIVALLPLSGWVSFKYDYYHSGCVVQLEESALYIAVIFPLGVGLTAIFVVIAFVIISKADRNLNDTQKLNGGKGWYKGNGSKPDENKNPNMATASANLIICTVSVVCFFPYFLIMFIRAAGVDMWRGSYSICLIPIVLTFTLRPWIYLFRLKMAIKSKENNTPRDPNAKNRTLAVSRKGKRNKQSGKSPHGNPGDPTYSSDEWSEYDDSEKRNKVCCFPKRSKKYDEKPSLDPPPYESDPEMKHPIPSPLRPIKQTNPGEKPKKNPVFKKPNQHHQNGSGVDEDEMSEFCLDGNSSESGSAIKPKNRSSLKKNKVKPSLKDTNNNAKNIDPKGRKKEDKRSNLSSDSDEPKENSKKNDPNSFLSPRMIQIKEIKIQKKRKPKKKAGDRVEENTISSEYSEDEKDPKQKRRRRKRRIRRPDEEDNSDSYDSYDESEDKQKKKPIIIYHSKESPKSKKRNVIKPKTSKEPIDKEKLKKQNRLNPFIRINMPDSENDKKERDKKEKDKSPKQDDKSAYETEYESDIESERDGKPRRKKRGKPSKQPLSTESEYSDDDNFKRRPRRKNRNDNDDSDDDTEPRKRRKRRRRRRPYSDEESVTENEYDKNGIQRKPKDVSENKSSNRKGNDGPYMNSAAENDHGIDGGVMEEMLRKNMDSKISVEVHHNHYYIDPTRVGDQKNDPYDETESTTYKSAPHGIPPNANWKNANNGDPTSSSLDPSKAENPPAKSYNNAPLNLDNFPNSQNSEKSENPSKLLDNLVPGDPLEPYKKRRLVPDKPKDSIPEHGLLGDPTKTLGPGDPIIPYEPEIVEDDSNLSANPNGDMPRNTTTNLLHVMGPGEPMQPYNDNSYNPKQQRNTADNLHSSPENGPNKGTPNMGHSTDNRHGESPDFTHLLGPGDPILKPGDNDNIGKDTNGVGNAIKSDDNKNKSSPNSNENQHYNNPRNPNDYPNISDSQPNRNNPNYANYNRLFPSDPVSQYGNVYKNPPLSNNDPNLPDLTENPNRFNPYTLNNGEKRANYPTITPGMETQRDYDPSNVKVSKPNDGRSNNPSIYSDTIPVNSIHQGKPQGPSYPYHKPGDKSNPYGSGGPTQTTSNPNGTSGQTLGPIPRSNLPQYNTHDPFYHNSPNSFEDPSNADRTEQKPFYPGSHYNPNDNTHKPNAESGGNRNKRPKQPSIPRSNLYSMNKPKQYMPDQVPNLGEFHSDPSRYPTGSQQPAAANHNIPNGYPSDPTHPSNENSSLPFTNNGYSLPNTDGRSDWDTPLPVEQSTTTMIPKQRDLIGPPKSYSPGRQKPPGGRAIKLGTDPPAESAPDSIPKNPPFDNQPGKNKLNNISNPESYVPSSNGNGQGDPGTIPYNNGVNNQYLPGAYPNSDPYLKPGNQIPNTAKQDDNPNGYPSRSNKPGNHQNNNPNGHPYQNSNDPNGHPNNPNKHGTHQNNYPNNDSLNPGNGRPRNPNGAPPPTYPNNGIPNNSSYSVNPQGKQPGALVNPNGNNPTGVRPQNPSANDPKYSANSNGLNRNPIQGNRYPNVQDHGNPNAQGYGNPNVQGHGNPNVQGHGNPNVQGHGNPNVQGHGNPNVQGHGNPNVQGYGNPNVQGHGNPNVQGYGNPNVQDHGNPNVQGYGNPNVQGHGNPNVQGHGNPNVQGHGNPNVQGHGNPNVQGHGNPNVQGHGNPNVQGYGNPNVQGHGNPNVQGHGNPNVQGHGNPNVQGYGNPNVQQPNKKVTFEPTGNSSQQNEPPRNGDGSNPETAIDSKSRAQANWKTARKKVFAYYHMTKLDKWDMVHGHDNKYDKRGKAPKVNKGGWKNQVKDIELI